MGRLEIQLSTALQPSSVERQVFIKGSRTTIDTVATRRRLGLKPEIQIVHDPQLLLQWRQQVSGFKCARKHKFLSAQRVKAVQRKRLDHEAKTIPLICPLLDGRFVPIHITHPLGHQYGILRISLTQSTRSVDRNIDAKNPLNALEFVFNPQALGTPSLVFLFVVVDAEFARFDSIHFNGKRRVIELKIGPVKLQVPCTNAARKFEITVLANHHLSISRFDDHTSVSRYIHPRNAFYSQLHIEQTDFSVCSPHRF